MPIGGLDLSPHRHELASDLHARGGRFFSPCPRPALGCGPGGTGLSGMLLGGPQVDDGLGQGRELEDEPELRDEWIAGDDGHGGQDPRCGAQAIACGGWAGQAPVGAPGGAVVGVGGSPQFLVAECPGGGIQDVRRSPGRIGRRAGIGGDVVADLLRGVTGGPGGVLVDGAAFGCGEPPGAGRCGGR
jgi:hypothetical protein